MVTFNDSLFQLNSDVSQIGYAKIIINDKNQNEFLTVVSAQLTRDIYLNGNLENNEAQFVLDKTIRKTWSMKLAKFTDFCTSQNFEKLI